MTIGQAALVDFICWFILRSWNGYRQGGTTHQTSQKHQSGKGKILLFQNKNLLNLPNLSYGMIESKGVE